jgi:hypothetical protein
VLSDTTKTPAANDAPNASAPVAKP